ncbi:hypothetical protein ACJ41O_008458 [Fusarium nematophilum]
MASIISSLVSWLGGGARASVDVLEEVPLPQREVNLEFLDDSHPKYKAEKLYYSNVPFTKTDAPNTNVISKKCRVTLHDIRGSENLLNLDVHGFELIKHSSNFHQWQDGRRVVQAVYPRIAELLKKRLGENVKVVVFDHTLRRSRPTDGGAGMSKGQQLGENFAPPSRVAHVDQTYEATVEQIKLDFKGEAGDILKGRFRIIKSVCSASIFANPYLTNTTPS